LGPEKLFDYVGTQTEILVVLHSKELVLRPWCMGELVTAHLKQPGVKIASIYFPDHTAPDDELIQGYWTSGSEMLGTLWQ